MKALISAVFVAVVVFFQQQKCMKVLLPSTDDTFLIVSPAKTAEPIKMIEVGRWGPDPPWEGALLRGMTSGFSHMPPISIPSGSNVGICPHAVDQHFSCRSSRMSH